VIPKSRTGNSNFRVGKIHALIPLFSRPKMRSKAGQHDHQVAVGLPDLPVIPKSTITIHFAADDKIMT
jgi:hypothetical protein